MTTRRRLAVALLAALGAGSCSGDVFHDTDWKPKPAATSGAATGGSGGASDGSGATGPTGSGGAAGAASSTASGSTAACTEYCKQITVACTGENAMYASDATCAATCPTFPAGLDGDTVGNSLACRTYHAGAATADPKVHCVHAGPGGAATCGSNCAGFCSIAMAVCPDAFNDDASCASACAAFADDVAYSASVTSGNTLACRLYHATAAAADPVTHCQHIAPVSSTCL